MTLHEALETTKIHSVAGKIGKNGALVARRPFRSPHHTTSDVALVGGGGFPQPGEISLAHNGVLFLDELPEFKRTVLEVMRQPLEDREVTVSRAKFSVIYPANFMLVASMNPCPCGYFNHPTKECVCGPQLVQRYLSKISGPLLDRIDIHVEVTPVEFDELASKREGEKSGKIRERVITAREIQTARFENQEGIHSNAMMPPHQVRKICTLNKAGELLLKTAMTRLDLSARAYDRILKVSRTIADLAGSENILPEHLAEAIQYRSLDRESWAG
jgi:magnesium chelatase family protein